MFIIYILYIIYTQLYIVHAHVYVHKDEKTGVVFPSLQQNTGK